METQNNKTLPTLTVCDLRRSVIYQPLAITMALLMLPVFSFLGSGTDARPFQAEAQIGGCETARGNLIIQKVCAGGVPFVDDLNALEKDAVNAYLAEHHLPDTEASLVYSLGRSDLRNAIRGNIMTILLGIIAKPDAQRTTHEKNLYTWLQTLVQQNEISLYTNAVNQFVSWRNDPCHFTLDPVIASAYGLSYDGAIFCASPLNSLLSGPPVPAESYFTAYGLKKSYGAAADQYPYFPSIMAGTAVNVGEVAGIAVAASAVVAAGLSTALALSLSSAIAAAVEVGLTSWNAIYTTSFAGIAIVAGEVGLGTLVAGAVGIVLAAIAIGVTAGLQAFTSEATINNLNNLNNSLTQATNNKPDLSAFALDTTGLGTYKLQSSMLAQTLPDVAGTNALPTHRNTDWNFVIGPNNTSTLTYLDWDKNKWTAQTWGGWFVQTCANGPQNCAQSDSFIATLRYIDWNGVNWSASRIADKFVSTKLSPAPTDKACPLDEIAGVSLGPDFSTCKSYYSTSIPLTDGAGNHVRVSLSPLAAPTFTSPLSIPFTPGVSSTQTITATGNPAPSICFSAGALPGGFTLNNGGCGTGSFQIAFNGSAIAKADVPLTLVASNGIDPAATKTFTLNIDDHLGITSPNDLIGTAGMPVNFLVTTTGNPAPALTIDPQVKLLGLTFKDNGNGTATISGTASQGYAFLACDPSPCGINATNTQGTVTQPFSIHMEAPPSAFLTPPSQAQFTAGIPNSILLQSAGALTPVSWTFSAPEGASWLTLTDNHNGTATLAGMPPVGTSATYTFGLGPHAAGTIVVDPPKYTVRVVPTPVFSTPNTATFTVGASKSFSVAANTGTIALSGTLPKGLTFAGGNPASISGIPAAGTGGQYTVTLTDNAGTVGSTTQALLLNVLESPQITSPNSATFVVGMPGSFAVTTSGSPSLSTAPVGQNPLPPTDPSQGQGMYFTVTGLPAGFQFSNLSPQGFATGTLTIQGTPTAAVAGTRQVQITAQNGVGTTAQQSLTLNIVNITGPAPATATNCNGNYNGSFTGNIRVTAGQNCTFVGGTVNGNIAVNGGNLALTNTKVTGNVSVAGGATVAIGKGTTISGNLSLQDIAAGSATNQICGATVNGSLTVTNNATPVQVGSIDVSCTGNNFGNNVTIQDNTAAAKVYNNSVDKSLSCSGNTSITGGGNFAQKKNGQCAAF